MKLSFTENDKSTYWDEVVLTIITVLFLAAGILLVVYKPSFWIVSSSFTVGIGIACIILSFMYFPCIVYRLMHNKTDKK